MSQAMALMGNINGYGQYAGTFNANANNDNGTVSVTADTAGMAFITDGLSKVLKINNICDNEHFGDCGIPDKYTQMFGSERIDFPKTLHEFRPKLARQLNPQNYINTKAVAFETQNGESVVAYYNPFCTGKDVIFKHQVYNEALDRYSDRFFYNHYICATYAFDVNGKKGPNSAGKDIWFMSTLYSDRLETVMFEPNRISKEKTDASYDGPATVQFCADHNARLATIEEGIVSLFSRSFSGFSFGRMKDYETNKIWALHSENDDIFPYTSTSASTYCLYRN